MLRLPSIKLLFDQCVDVLLPACCLLCGQFCGRGQLCSACHRELPRLSQPCRQCASPGVKSETMLCGECLRAPPGWDLALSALAYEYPVKQLVHRFKFRRNLACGRLLARELLTTVQLGMILPPTVIIPVPLHFTRQAWRGFNQSEILARYLGKRLEIPVVSNCLKRCRRTRAQSGLDRRSRGRNLHGAFAGKGLVGSRVALVDDVLTTGTTLRECARAVRAAGASHVSVWVAARVAK